MERADGRGGATRPIGVTAGVIGIAGGKKSGRRFVRSDLLID